MLSRNQSLDTIRGIAIILVILAHYFSNSIKYDDITYILGNYTINIGFLGRGGVMLFFFLSGFLITKSFNNNQNLVSFYKSRFFRIYPPYLFSILIYFLLSIFLFRFTEQYSFKEYLYNILMIQDFLYSPFVSNVYWTLLIEIKFYFLIPLIFLFDKKIKISFIDITFISIIMLNIYIFFMRGHPSWLLTWFVFFWIGVYLYKHYTQSISLRKLFIISFSAFIYLVLLKEFVLSCFLIINLILFMFFYHKNISNKFIAFLGEISYSFYLLHTMISYPLLYLMTKYITQEFLLVKVLIVFLISVFISYFSYYYIERLYYKIKGD